MGETTEETSAEQGTSQTGAKIANVTRDFKPVTLADATSQAERAAILEAMAAAKTAAHLNEIENNPIRIKI